MGQINSPFPGVFRMYVVTLKKQVTRRTRPAIVKRQMAYVCERALKGPRGKGWVCKVVAMPTTPKDDGVFSVSRLIRLEKKSGKQEVEAAQWKDIYRYLATAAATSQGGSWNVECLQAPEDVDVPSPAMLTPNTDTRNYSGIHIEYGPHFDHLYGLDDHIELTLATLRLAQQTDLQKRIHTVYVGPPGCGKTDLTLAIGKMLGKENEDWLKFDATSTTQAGAIKKLMESATIPPVLLLEEAEKTPEVTLRWLLGVLDTRGEVRQTNFRVGNRMKNVKMVCIATVNDEAKFREVMHGALASRFANKVYFARPKRETMAKILEREIRSINGKMEWIEPTLQFCMDRLHWDDPREIIPICLCGQDSLLDGTYQQRKLNTLPPKSKENLDKPKNEESF